MAPFFVANVLESILMKKIVLILLSFLFVYGHADIFCMSASDFPDDFSAGTGVSKFAPACFFEIPVDDLMGQDSTDSQGFPTEDTIKKLSEYCFLKHFDGHDIHVKTVKQFADCDRVYTAFINPSKQDIRFVFKAYVGAKGQDSYNKMQAIMHGPWGTASNIDRMKIVMPIGFFTYQHQGVKRYIEVTEGARTALNLREMFAIPSFLSSNVEAIQCMFFSIGSMIGALHKMFMRQDEFMLNVLQWKTHLHGDLHIENILWRCSLQKAFIIDLWTSYFSLNNRQSIDYDIIAFVFTPLLYWGWLEKDKAQVLIEHSVFFLRGYVSVFPDELRPRLTAYIKDIIVKHFTAAQLVVNNIFSRKAGDLLREIVQICYPDRSVLGCREYESYEVNTWNKFIDKMHKRFASLQSQDEKEGYKKQLFENFSWMSGLINCFDTVSGV